MDYTNSALVKGLLGGLSFEINSLKTEISRLNREMTKLQHEMMETQEGQQQPIPFFNFATEYALPIGGEATQTVYSFTPAKIPEATFTKALEEAGGDINTFNGGVKPDQADGLDVAISVIGKGLFYTETQFTAADGTVIPAKHFFTNDFQKVVDLGDNLEDLGFELGGEEFAKDERLPLKINGELVYVTNKVVKDIHVAADKVAPWGVELSQPIAGCQYVRVLSAGVTVSTEQGSP